MNEESLKRLLAEALPETIVTQWILVAEVLLDDCQELQVVTSPNMTPWLASGMLGQALGIITAYRGDDEDDDDID